MSADHRRTAAEWHDGASSSLYAYASTGTVRPGLFGEIADCLTTVERGQIDVDIDAVEEHGRLTALLHHIAPQLASQQAGQLGAHHGRTAAAWWEQDTLGGRATGDVKPVAERILRGIEDDDPAILDQAPGWDQTVSLQEVLSSTGWAEPSADDRQAHDRWSAGLPSVCDAYASAFAESFWDSVAQACRNELSDEGVADVAHAPRSVQPQGPYIRSCADPASSPAPPTGWVVESIGLWGGQNAEVVYDPRCTDVGVAPVSDDWAHVFEPAGWEMAATDGRRQLWTSDRVNAVANALDRHGQSVGPTAAREVAPSAAREVAL